MADLKSGERYASCRHAKWCV